MAIRTRVRRAFTRGSSASSPETTPASTTTPSNSDLTTTSTLAATATAPPTITHTHTTTSTKFSKSKRFRLFRKQTSEWDDWPDHLYKPHEVPPPKYKRVPAKEHTEHLEAFSFATAFRDNLRRRSGVSLYSPMGSRFPSCLNSVAPSRSQSVATHGGSIAEQLEDGDAGAGDENGSGSTGSAKIEKLSGTATPVRASTPVETNGAATLIPLTVHTTALTTSSARLSASAMPGTPTTAHDDSSTPSTSKTLSTDEVETKAVMFTGEELAHAMAKSTLVSSTTPAVSVANGGITA